MPDCTKNFIYSIYPSLPFVTVSGSDIQVQSGDYTTAGSYDMVVTVVE